MTTAIARYLTMYERDSQNSRLPSRAWAAIAGRLVSAGAVKAANKAGGLAVQAWRRECALYEALDMALRLEIIHEDAPCSCCRSNREEIARLERELARHTRRCGAA